MTRDEKEIQLRRWFLDDSPGDLVKEFLFCMENGITFKGWHNMTDDELDAEYDSWASMYEDV
jgi:hypothetical protein